MAMYKKKGNQTQQDSTQTSPLNDQEQTLKGNNQKIIMLPQIHVRIHIQKAKIKMIKANNSLKIINTHKQNINLILKNKIMIKIHQIKKQHPSDQTQDLSSKGTQPKQSQSIEDRDKTVKQPSSKVHKIGNTKTDKTVKTNQKKQTSLTSPRVVKSKQTKHINQLTAQAQYKNQYPVVFVHGFVGLVGEDAFSMYPNYWGGTKYNVKKELTKLGYRVHEANVGAFSSNYDRAVELYYYIKGGRVDYGAAHAAKYGHKRYGRTYEGIMPDWEPGKKDSSCWT